MTMTDANASREPARLELPLAGWAGLTPDERERCYEAVDREIDEVGIVAVAGALSRGRRPSYPAAE